MNTSRTLLAIDPDWTPEKVRKLMGPKSYQDNGKVNGCFDEARRLYAASQKKKVGEERWRVRQ